MKNRCREVRNRANTREIPKGGMDFQDKKKLLNFLIRNFYRAMVEMTEAEVISIEIS